MNDRGYKRTRMHEVHKQTFVPRVPYYISNATSVTGLASDLVVAEPGTQWLSTNTSGDTPHSGMRIWIDPVADATIAAGGVVWNVFVTYDIGFRGIIL